MLSWLCIGSSVGALKSVADLRLHAYRTVFCHFTYAVIIQLYIFMYNSENNVDVVNESR